MPFVHEMVRYLAGARERPRDFLVADVPRGLPREPGVATLQDSGRRIVVNVDPRESVPEPLSADAFAARLAELRVTAPAGRMADDAARQESEQFYWGYALLAMIAVLVGEAWLGRTMA